MENSNTQRPRLEPMKDRTDQRPILPCSTVTPSSKPTASKALATPSQAAQEMERAGRGERLGVPQPGLYRILSANDGCGLTTLLAVLKATGFRLP